MARWRIRTTAQNTPDHLATLACSLARLQATLRTLRIEPILGGTLQELVLDAPAQTSPADLAAAIGLDGGVSQISVAETPALADEQTQALRLAARLLTNPEDLPGVLGDLLGDCTISWSPHHLEGEGLEATTMRLRDPEGGLLTVTRPAPFTPTEFVRACTLIDLAAVVDPFTAAAPSCLVELADGAEVVLRRAVPGDLEAVVAMHARCSPASRYRRYLTARPQPSRHQFERLLAPRRGYALLAETEGRVVALANLMPDGSEAEAAVLVEDAWQRRGLGTALLDQLVDFASRTGVEVIYALSLPDNRAMISTMAKLGLPLGREFTDGLLTITVRLDRHRRGSAERLRPPLAVGSGRCPDAD